MSQRFWSALARELHPYTPGEQPRRADLLKLNTNESPYPPSPRVLEAIAATSGEQLLRYPDPQASELRATIATYYGLNSDQVFLGNGSDEVLSHVFLALLKHPKPLLFPDICYSFYPVWCQLHGIEYELVPLEDDFRISVDAYDTAAPAVILPNPNAPTGCLLSLDELRRMALQAPDRLLVVDEAYIDFGGDSAVPLIHETDNVLIVQTLSKSRSLAGIRVGLALGSADLVEALERVKDSFNSYPLDIVAQRAAQAAFADQAWFDECRRKVMEDREYLRDALQVMGFEVLPSAGNFLFVAHTQRVGAELFEALRQRGVIVRRWDKPRIDNYLRITVGTREQCDRLLATLEEIL